MVVTIATMKVDKMMMVLVADGGDSHQNKLHHYHHYHHHHDQTTSPIKYYRHTYCFLMSLTEHSGDDSLSWLSC